MTERRRAGCASSKRFRAADERRAFAQVNASDALGGYRPSAFALYVQKLVAAGALSTDQAVELVKLAAIERDDLQSEQEFEDTHHPIDDC